MRILVTHPLDPDLAGGDLGERVVYRPELAGLPEDALRQALVDLAPEAVLLGDRCPHPGTLAAWKARRTPNVCVVSPTTRRALLGADPGFKVEAIDTVMGPREHDLEALGRADRRLAHFEAAPKLAACGISSGGDSPLEKSHVTLVGAGILGLIAALDLTESGARIDVFDKGPDPRLDPAWERLGATHGGENARMFCFTEADNYNQRPSAVYSGMTDVLRETVSAGGWLAVPPESLGSSERAWIRRFQTIPHWRAEVFSEDIYRFNVASGTLWEQTRRSVPQLFENVGRTPGVLRLYSQPEKATAARNLHQRLGSLQRSIDLDELRRRHPALRPAIDANEIAGAFEVRGFTLNVHDFARNLLDELEKRGVRLHFDREVTGIESDSDEHVVGLRTREGFVRSDHYVVSPGAYGPALFDGTRSAGKIQGILGIWMILPNLSPRLRRSVKIHREGHVGEDSNVTLGVDRAGRPILILGSGYGFIGEHPLDVDSPEIACLQRSLAITAQRFFPLAYEALREAGTIGARMKACIRPFTSTGLGILEVRPTREGGRLVIATGHNTGGFTQAPAVAEAVTATLRGREHPMQSLYDPERGL